MPNNNDDFKDLEGLLGGDKLKKELNDMLSGIVNEAMKQAQNVDKASDTVSKSLTNMADELIESTTKLGDSAGKGDRLVSQVLSRNKIPDSFNNQAAKISVSSKKYFDALRKIQSEMNTTFLKLDVAKIFDIKSAMKDIPDFDYKSIEKYMTAFQNLNTDASEQELKNFENQMYRYKKLVKIFNDNKSKVKTIDFKNIDKMSVEDATKAISALTALKKSGEELQKIQYQFKDVFNGSRGFKQLFLEDNDLQKFEKNIDSRINKITSNIEKQYEAAADSVIKDVKRVEEAVAHGEREKSNVKLGRNIVSQKSSSAKIVESPSISDFNYEKYLRNPSENNTEHKQLYNGLNQYFERLGLTNSGKNGTIRSQKDIADLIARIAQILRVEEASLEDWLNNTKQVNDNFKNFVKSKLEIPEYQKVFDTVLNYKSNDTIEPTSTTVIDSESTEQIAREAEKLSQREIEAAQESAQAVVEAEKTKQQARQETVQQQKNNDTNKDIAQEDSIDKKVTDFYFGFSKLKDFPEYGNVEWITEYIEQIKKGEIDVDSALESLKNRISEKMAEVQEEQRINLENNTQVQEFANFFNGDEEELKKYSDLLSQIASGQIKAQEAIAQVEAERQSDITDEASEISSDALEQEGTQAELTAQKIEKKNEASEKSLKIAQQIMDLVGATGKNTKLDIAESLDNNQNINSILKILSQDKKVIDNSDLIDPLYKQVKDYLKNSSIKFDSSIVSEFGDDWRSIINTIGTKSVTKNGTSDIITTLSEMNEALGTTFDTTVSVQDGFRQLYDYLSDNKLDSSFIVDEWKNVGLVDEIQDIISINNSEAESEEKLVEVKTRRQQLEEKLGKTLKVSDRSSIPTLKNEIQEEEELINVKTRRQQLEEKLGKNLKIASNAPQLKKETQAEQELTDAKEEIQKVEEKQKDYKSTTSFTTAIESETKAEKESGDTVVEQENRKQKEIEETAKAREKAAKEAEKVLNKEKLNKISSNIPKNYKDISNEDVENLFVDRTNEIKSSIPTDAVNASWSIDKDGQISGQLQYINKETKQVVTEIYKWTEAVDEIGNVYEGLELVSTKYSDKEIDRIQAQERAQQKLTEAQTKYQSKLSGINNEFSNLKEYKDVESAISELSNASDSVTAINKVDTAFNNLNKVINEFKQNVKGTGSLDPVISSLRKFDNIDNIAKGLEQSFVLMGYSADEASKKVSKLYEIIDRLKKVNRTSDTGMIEFSNIMKEFNLEESRLNASIPIEKNQLKIQNQQKTLDLKKQGKSNELIGFISQLEESGKLTEAVQLKIDGLFDSLNKVSSTSGLSQWNEEFKNLKNTIDDLPKTFQEQWDQTLSIMDKNASQQFKNERQEIFNSYKNIPKDTTKVSGTEWTGVLAQENAEVINQYNQLISKTKELAKARQELVKLSSDSEKNPTIDYSEQVDDVKNKISSLIGDIRELNKNDFINQNKDILGEDRIEKYADELNKAELAEKRLADEAALRIQKSGNEKIIQNFNKELNKINQLKDAYTELLRLHSQMVKNPTVDYSEQIKAQENVINELLKDSGLSDSLTNQNKFNDNQDILGTKRIEKFKDAIYDATKAQTTFYNKFNDDKIQEVNSAISRTTSLMNSLSKINTGVNGFEQYFDNAQKEINQLNVALQHGMDLDSYEKKINNIVQSLVKFAGTPTGLDSKSMYDDMRNYLQTLTKGEVVIKNFDSTKRRMVATYEPEKGKVQQVILQYNALANAYERVKDEAKGALTPLQQLGNFFKGKFGNLVGYLSSFAVFHEIWAQIKQGVTYVRELDTALTEMRKVSDETVESLREFQEVSFATADAIGTTAKEIQNSTADFMRLGYTLQEAGELAEDANIYANVGDMDIDEATEHMISSIKAWGSEFESEVEASEAIIDRYNEIGM